MTTTYDFMRAIIAEPDVDLHRLAYADWLDEHNGTVPCPECRGPVVSSRPSKPLVCGTCLSRATVPNHFAARAEFIRVQCELAGLGVTSHIQLDPENPEDRRVGHRLDALRRRERDLWISGLLAHCKPAGWPELVLHRWEDQPDYTPSGPEAYARRGFVEAVTCSAQDWLAHGAEIRRCQPVTRVTLTDVPRVVAATDGTHHLYGLIPMGFAFWRVVMSEHAARPLAQRLLGERFPGVTFEMPPAEFRYGSVEEMMDDQGGDP